MVGQDCFKSVGMHLNVKKRWKYVNTTPSTHHVVSTSIRRLDVRCVSSGKDHKLFEPEAATLKTLKNSYKTAYSIVKILIYL